MSSFIITKLNGTTFDLYNKSKSTPSTIISGTQNSQLLSEDTLTVQTKSARPLPIEIGDKCTIYGKKYKVNTKPSVKKQGPRKFITDIIFEGVQYDLLDAQFILPDNTIGESFTGNLRDFIQLLIGNANRIGLWIIGDCPDVTEYKTLTFTAENCLSVLQKLCEEWGQEFEIEQSGNINILHIRTAGVHFPYTFTYGSKGGLYELVRKNINSENIVTRLYAYGGSNNLGSNYLSSRGCGRLCLPGKIKNNSFVQTTDAINNYGLKENTKMFDSIFPNRYGVVTAIGDNYLSLFDETMDFDLNEKESDGVTTKWLIAGVSAKIRVNTGNLAGYEFEIESYDHTNKKIKLISFDDANGMEFPNPESAAFQLREGDEYFFIDIRLPQSYIDAAEAKLLSEAEAYYAQNSQPRVQYELSIHDIFLKQFSGQVTIANLFAPGDYVPVKDDDISVNKSIRITGFTRDILKPYKYDITLGEAVTKTTISRLIKEQQSVDEIIQINGLNDPSRARRNWRASQEVLNMVFDPEGHYFTDRIRPLSIETSMLQVGAKSMQFVLSNVIFEPNYQGNPNVIRVGGGRLVHYTIEETIREWNIATETVSGLQSTTAYYIYARCTISENAGNIIIDTIQRRVDHEEGYYTFMIGVLNSVETDSDGKNPGRLVSLTYGSSTINGRFIRTGRIESSGGSGSFFDLDDNQFRIGNENQGLSWNIGNDGRLLLRGTMVQSGSGDVSPLGCFRGAFNLSYVYYKGDEVTYQGSSFRYINNTPTSGNAPTNTNYWTVIASAGQNGSNGSNGTNGQDGTFFEYRYAVNGSTTTPPTLSITSANPSGWTTTMPSVGTLQYLWMTVAQKNAAGALLQNWSTPVRASGVQGPAGQDGQDGVNGSFTSFVFKTSSTQPATPTGTNPLPSGWVDAPSGNSGGLSNISHGTTWSLQSDGTRKSPTIDHNGFTKNRINFTTTQANQIINIFLKVSSESGYDFALIGLLNNANLSLSANYTDRISGEIEKTISVNVPNAGNHFIEVGYGKDSSVSNGQDAAWYSVIYGSTWWMSKATVSYQSGQWLAGQWSTPVQVTGEDGLPGADGKFWDYKYRVGSTQPATPSGLQPSGWYDIPPTTSRTNFLWMSYAEKNAAQTEILTNWTTPVRISGENGYDGVNGVQGAIGPSIVFRGEYSSSATYYGTTQRVDVVKYNNIYYVARTDAGNGFTGRTPTQMAYWNTFGAQFDSVATNLLLAEMANIAGWIFRNQRLESQSGGAFLDGVNGILSVGNDSTGKKILIDTNTTRGAAMQLLNTLNNSVAAFTISDRTISSVNRSSGMLQLTEYEGGTVKSSVYLRPYSLQISSGTKGFFASVGDDGIANIQIRDLPTSNPGGSGQLWRDSSGYLRINA